MDTKDKAQELIEKFRQCVSGSSCAKEASLIAVDEILANFEGLHKPEYSVFDAIGERKFTFDGEYPEHMTGYDMVDYWEEVRDHIRKT